MAKKCRGVAGPMLDRASNPTHAGHCEPAAGNLQDWPRAAGADLGAAHQHHVGQALGHLSVPWVSQASLTITLRRMLDSVSPQLQCFGLSESSRG